MFSSRHNDKVVAEDGETVRVQWQFRQTWQCRYMASVLNENANGIAFEIIEFAHEGLIRTK